MFGEVTRELLSNGYGVRFRPPGHSMRPTICDGELVTVEPVAAWVVRRGDILLYQTARGLTAHRVVSMKSELGLRLFVTRGDSATSDDEPVSAQQVLGRVVSVQRDGRAVRLDKLGERMRWTIIRPRLSSLRARLRPVLKLMSGTRAG